MSTKKPIPTHELKPEQDLLSFKLVRIEEKTDYVVTEAHRHDYYEIFFFLKGEGEHMIDFRNHKIGARNMHFVAPGQVHMLRRSGDTEGYVMCFSEEFFYFDRTNRDALRDIPFLAIDSPEPLVRLDENLFAFLKDIVAQISREVDSPLPFREDIIRSYINILLLKCKSAWRPDPKSVPNESAGLQLYRGFRKLIEQHYTKVHRVSDYAAMLSVTPNHLNDTIRKAVGKTAGDVIQDRLLLEARRSLVYSVMTAKEIAYAIGFNDPAYFSRFFKTHTGMSPEEFRTQIREKYHY